ncbi:cardiolipin synthase [Mesonia sp. K7]|uniref:cardiolipin synthase n=1 Tax=Mesonia sp. K7 TaxID=2218606 RepID=UPI000DAA729E|nr:cardiolipin synthase [Mesonia sp. K7]PZD77900.1 cardiolipin synthase [Mesonia sp. K7]
MLEYLKANWFQSLMILNYIIAFITAIFIILHNRNPTTTLSYILSLVLLPFVGLLIYFFFGQEYRKDKMFQRKKVFDSQIIKKWERKLLIPEEKLDEYEAAFLDANVNVVKILQNNQKKPLMFGNDIKILLNGDEKFEALFEDIKNAKKHIHLEYYILKFEKIGEKLIDLLCEKAKEGVKVRIIYDYVGSQIKKKGRQKLEQHGIEIYAFMQVWFPNLTRKLNYRDHRKIVIIDGEIGYVGGINICDEYVNSINNHFWRDTHLRIRGNTVKSLQSHFLLMWNFVSEQEIEIIDEFFPEMENCGEVAAQVAVSGPDSNYPHIMQAIFTAITTAEESILITTPYFIPNEEIYTALITAARRGVEVKIIIPKENDSWAAKYASTSYIESLLEAGIQFYFYTKGMVHAKTMVIDNDLSIVGTSNMDYRSFEINFEVIVLVYNKSVSQQMIQIFEDDIKDCEEVVYKQWIERPLSKKLKESFCRLWAPLL